MCCTACCRTALRHSVHLHALARCTRKGSALRHCRSSPGKGRSWSLWSVRCCTPSRSISMWSFRYRWLGASSTQSSVRKSGVHFFKCTSTCLLPDLAPDAGTVASDAVAGRSSQAVKTPQAIKLYQFTASYLKIRHPLPPLLPTIHAFPCSAVITMRCASMRCVTCRAASIRRFVCN